MANNTLERVLPAFMQAEVIKNWDKKYLKLAPKEKKFFPDIKVKLPSHLKKEFFDSLFWSVWEKKEDTYNWNSLMSDHPEIKSFLTASIIQEYKGIINPNAFDVFTGYYLFKNKNVLYIPDVKKTKANIAAGHTSPLVLTKNIGSFHTWKSAVGRIKEQDICGLFYNFYSSISLNRLDQGRAPIIFKDKPIYLVITSKPSDILRMAISEYFDSCQNLYTGEIRSRLLSNVFDKNMKIAYIACDIPYTDKQNNVHPMTTFARRILRKKQNGEIYFDRAYPDCTELTFTKILNEMGVRNTPKAGQYHINRAELYGLMAPYMDRMTLRYEVQKTTIAKFKKWLENSFRNKDHAIYRQTSVDFANFIYDLKQNMRGLGVQGKKIFVEHLLNHQSHGQQLNVIIDVLKCFSKYEVNIPPEYYQILLDELKTQKRKFSKINANNLLNYHVNDVRSSKLDKQVITLVHGILPINEIVEKWRPFRRHIPSKSSKEFSPPIQKYLQSLCITKAQKKEYEMNFGINK